MSTDQLTITQMTGSSSGLKMHNNLKNRQTQSHEKISAHQNIIELAKHIIYFLMTYLNAQMGLFYLVVLTSSLVNKKAPENTPALKLITSYAFIYPKPFANEFQFGDGFVGQATFK